MYAMLFYDKYFNRWEYNLVDTEKKVSELQELVFDWIENNTNLRFPILPVLSMPYFNPIHSRIITSYGRYEVEHDFSHEMPITMSFYNVNVEEIIDKKSNEPIFYYLTLLNHNDWNWKMLAVKTNKDIISILKDKAESDYDFKCNKISKEGRKFVGDNSYVSYLYFRLTPIKT